MSNDPEPNRRYWLIADEATGFHNAGGGKAPLPDDFRALFDTGGRLSAGAVPSAAEAQPLTPPRRSRRFRRFGKGRPSEYPVTARLRGLVEAACRGEVEPAVLTAVAEMVCSPAGMRALFDEARPGDLGWMRQQLAELSRYSPDRASELAWVRPELARFAEDGEFATAAAVLRDVLGLVLYDLRAARVAQGHLVAGVSVPGGAAGFGGCWHEGPC